MGNGERGNWRRAASQCSLSCSKSATILPYPTPLKIPSDAATCAQPSAPVTISSFLIANAVRLQLTYLPRKEALPTAGARPCGRRDDVEVV